MNTRANLESAGYIRRTAAAKILGMADGSNVRRLLEAEGVVPVVQGKRLLMFYRADVGLVAAKRARQFAESALTVPTRARPAPPRSLEERVAELERRLEEFALFCEGSQR